MDENTTFSGSSVPVMAEAMPSLDLDPLGKPGARGRASAGRANLAAEPLQDSSGWREVAVLLPIIVVADMTIYRGSGYAGWAVLFAVVPLLLALGAPRPSFRHDLWIVGLMQVLLAMNLAWCGSWLQVALGFALMVAFAMALSGLRPYVLDILAYTLQAGPVGLKNLLDHVQWGGRAVPLMARVRVLGVVLPAAAILAFGSLFVLANPELAAAVKAGIQEVFRSLHVWIASLGLSVKDVVFWFFVAWIAAGLLRPMMRESILDQFAVGSSRTAKKAVEPVCSLLYVPYRNMLLALVALFAAYLPFEFATLWFREFPEGFYYAGYAHEGAAWLTVALALATGVLSLVFRGSVLRDPRLPQLRRLTWLWVLENALLAAAVYNRLLIYVHFNGMTRMRTVGLFGMTLVVVGFVLVVWKVVHQRDFVWLVRRQLLALAVTVYLFAVTPVDVLVHAYNVRQVLAGDLAPSVQISVHPIDSAGILVLPPLVTCEDPIIREGIRAMLADRYLAAEANSQRRSRRGWTAYQAADVWLLSHLAAMRPYWEPYTDPERRREAIARFKAYAYQWY